MKCHEVFSQPRLAYIIAHQHEFFGKCRITDPSWDPFQIPTKLMNMSSGGKLSVEYHQPDGRAFGRFFADNSVSLQMMQREIRHTIAGEFYDDVDMVNAHPIILMQLCAKHEIDCVRLTEYINNREKILSDIVKANEGVDREDAKRIVLCLVNNGTSDYKKLKVKTKFLERFKIEMNTILSEFKEVYQAEFKFRSKKKPDNPMGSTINAILCENENKILMSVFEFFKIKKIIDRDNPTAVLCFDGIMIPKHEDTAGLLGECQAFALSQTGFAIELKIKPMDDGFDMPAEIPQVEEFKAFDPHDKFCWKDFDEKWRGQMFDNEFDVIAKTRVDLSRVFCRVTKTKSSLVKKNDCGDSLIDIMGDSPRFTDMYFMVKREGKPAVEMSFATYIKKFNKHINVYSTINFTPGSDDSNVFNLWVGYLANITAEPDMSKLDLILDHIRNVICAGSDESFDYFMDLQAFIFKYPGVPPGIATFLYSREQGTGKNIIFDFFEKYVYGENLTYYSTGLDTILNAHNNLLKNKKIIILDEIAGEAGTFMSSFDKLKSLMTGSSFVVNPKGIDQFSIKNVLAYTFLSNHNNCLRIEPGDRRYFCLSVAPSKVGNVDYFTRLAASFSREAGDAFFTYAIQRYEDRGEPSIRQPPLNDFKREIISHGFSSSIQFLISRKSVFDALSADERADESSVRASVLFREYVSWCSINGERPKSAAKFGRDIMANITKKKSSGIWYDLSSIVIR